MTRASLALLVAPLTACGVNPDEAQLVFDSLTTVQFDIATTAQAQVAARGDGGEWTVEEQSQGYAFNGTVDGGSAWQGAIAVDGTARLDVVEGLYESAYDADTTWSEVTASGVTLDGPVEIQFIVFAEDDGSTAWRYTASGEVFAAGEARGSAPFHYTVDVAFDAATRETSFGASGDLAGHAVGAFDLSAVQAGW